MEAQFENMQEMFDEDVEKLKKKTEMNTTIIEMKNNLQQTIID